MPAYALKDTKEILIFVFQIFLCHALQTVTEIVWEYVYVTLAMSMVLKGYASLTSNALLTKWFL